MWTFVVFFSSLYRCISYCISTIYLSHSTQCRSIQAMYPPSSIPLDFHIFIPLYKGAFSSVSAPSFWVNDLELFWLLTRFFYGLAPNPQVLTPLRTLKPWRMRGRSTVFYVTELARNHIQDITDQFSGTSLCKSSDKLFKSLYKSSDNYLNHYLQWDLFASDHLLHCLSPVIGCSFRSSTSLLEPSDRLFKSIHKSGDNYLDHYFQWNLLSSKII